MHLRPLGDDAGLAIELILLKPTLNVGRDELAFLWTAAVFHDRAELPGDTFPQEIVVGSPVTSARSCAVVGRSRRTGLEIFVRGKRLRDQPGADRFAIPIEQNTSIGLVA